MNRWSLAQYFQSVTAADFRAAVDTVASLMAQASGSPAAVKILCYDGLKESITTWDPGLQAFLDQRNESRIFETLTRSADLTDDLWLKTQFIEAVFTPADAAKAPAYSYVHLEAKGLLRRQMGFYAQPDEIAAPVRAAVETKFRMWRKGDGMDSNHIVSVG
ncbi:MAG: hypothetical protein HYU57_08510 [Micavibrio aeruginosavorus]|nr:hypothetical protein [Micavibrio aeruginosavorus]